MSDWSISLTKYSICTGSYILVKTETFFYKNIYKNIYIQEHDHTQPTCQYLKFKISWMDFPDVYVSYLRVYRASYNMHKILHLMTT